MSRVLILSGIQISTNPRVVKEADALSELGHDVEIVGATLEPGLSDRDDALTRAKPWKYTRLADAGSKGLGTRVSWQARRIRRRLWRGMATFGVEDVRQLGYVAHEMLEYATEFAADLTIVHLPAAMWVGRELIKRGFTVSADMEDWYSEDVAPGTGNYPVALLKECERFVLRNGCGSVTTSQSLSDALVGEYQCPAPGVVYNTFSLRERDGIDGRVLDRRDLSIPSICWFSQVVGPGRGVETIIDSLGYFGIPIELHLRGTVDAGYRAALLERAPEELRARIFFHDQVPHAELIARVAEHDIGVAADIAGCRSRALTLVNKVPFYLLAGLPVVASDTEGQVEAAAIACGAVSVFRAGDARSLAFTVQSLAGNVARLRNGKKLALKAADEVFCWERSKVALQEHVTEMLHASRAMSGSFSS